MEKITIRKGFDAHVHLRDGEMMEKVLPCTTQQFASGVCMGNLPGELVIDSVAKNKEYVSKISSLAPSFNAIVPLMITRKLLQQEDIVNQAAKNGIRVFKFIPGGLSTNGAEGLTLYDLYSDLFRRFLKKLEVSELIFSCHFEVGTRKIRNDIPVLAINQEREAIRFLLYLLEVYPKLKIVVEHVSSCAMIKFIDSLPKEYQVAATITPHHAKLSLWDVCYSNLEIADIFKYCKPIAKQEEDIKSVMLAMCSGNPRYFAGSDSAPHYISVKMESKNPVAGIFSAPVAMQTYTEIFDQLGRLEHLENFTSVFGPQFYGIEPSEEKITLVKEKRRVLLAHHCEIAIFRGKEDIPWNIEA